MGLFDFSNKERDENSAIKKLKTNGSESLDQDEANDNDMFLFDSDDESVGERPTKATYKRRDDSLLTKIRHGFERNKELGLNLDVESLPESPITQPTQVKTFLPQIQETSDNDIEHQTTQPTQIKHIFDARTQPTQIEHGSIIEEDDDIVIKQTEMTHLKDSVTHLTQNKAVITQPTQLKSKFYHSLNLEQDNAVENSNASKQKVKDSFSSSENEDFTQPTQLQRNILNAEDDMILKVEPKKTQVTQLRPLFDDYDNEDEDNDFLPLNKQPEAVLTTESIAHEEEHQFYDDPIIVKNNTTFVGSTVSIYKPSSKGSELDNTISRESKKLNDGFSDDTYDSDISDFEFDLKPIEKSLFEQSSLSNNHFSNKGIDVISKIDIESDSISLKQTTSKEVITFLFSDDEDDDYIAPEKGATRATTLAIKAHLAQKKYQNKTILKKGAEKRKSSALNTDCLVEKLKKEAFRQAKSLRGYLGEVDKLYEEVVLKNQSENKIESTQVPVASNEMEVDDNEVNKKIIESSFEFQQSEYSDENQSDSEVAEKVVEEISYGKKKSDIIKASNLHKVELNNVAMESDESSASETDKKNLSIEGKDGTVKLKIDRSKVISAKIDNSEPNQFNPFVEEEAEESQSDDDMLKFKKDDEENVDNEIHTSDEEMMDDNSDLENNEELLRNLNREQLIIDEEKLEKKIQQTLKGTRRGDRDEFGDDNYEDDLENDNEYIEYKRRQALLNEQVVKRMNKSSKNKMNVLDGLNSRIVLPESKIAVLDKMTVSSTLSFLGPNSEEPTQEQKQEEIQKQVSGDEDIVERKLDVSEIKQRLQERKTENNDESKLKASPSDSSSDDEDGYNSLSFFRKGNNFIKKQPVEDENLKFRLGTKSYTRNYMGGNNVLKTSSESLVKIPGQDNSQKHKKEVPFLGKKRQLKKKVGMFKTDYKRYKYSQNSFSKNSQK